MAYSLNSYVVYYWYVYIVDQQILKEVALLLNVKKKKYIDGNDVLKCYNPLR